MEKLPCGHPATCLIDDGEGRMYCDWCNDLNILRGEIAALRGQLERKAVKVTGGVAKFDGDIGYLHIENGTIEVGTPTISTINMIPTAG
jgi:hypothetical protein